VSRSPYPDTCPAPPTSVAVSGTLRPAYGRSRPQSLQARERQLTSGANGGGASKAGHNSAVRSRSRSAASRSHTGRSARRGGTHKRHPGQAYFPGRPRRFPRGPAGSWPRRFAARSPHRRGLQRQQRQKEQSGAHCPVLHLKKARTLREAHYNAIGPSRFRMIAIILEGSMAAAFIACSSPA
jgi:hypothetical protein